MSLQENAPDVNGVAHDISTSSEIGHNGGPPLDDDARYADPKGAIMVGRSIRDHYLVGFGSLGKHSKAEAWLDLIMECRYKAGTVMNAGRSMEIKPGQLVGAVSWLAARWNWSPREVRTFLDRLQDEGMIERFAPGATPVEKTDLDTNHSQAPSKSTQQRGKQAQVLTISKYSIYQFIRDVSRQAKRQASDKQATSSRHASDMIQIRKEGNKEIEDCESVCAGEGLGHGVTFADNVVKHRGFAISIDALAMEFAQSGFPGGKPELYELAERAAKAAALQWAVQINNGKHSQDVVPRHVTGSIRASLQKNNWQIEANASRGRPKPNGKDYAAMRARASELVGTEDSR